MIYDRVSPKYISYMVGEAKMKLKCQYLCKKHGKTLETMKQARKRASKVNFRPSFEYVKAKMYIEEDFRLNGFSGQTVRKLFEGLGV